MKKYLVLGLLLCFAFAGFAKPTPVSPVKKLAVKKAKLKKYFGYPASVGYTLDGNPAWDGMDLYPGTYTLAVIPNGDVTSSWWDIYASDVTVNWQTATTINFTFTSGYILFKCYLTNSGNPNHWEPFGFATH